MTPTKRQIAAIRALLDENWVPVVGSWVQFVDPDYRMDNIRVGDKLPVKAVQLAKGQDGSKVLVLWSYDPNVNPVHSTGCYSHRLIPCLPPEEDEDGSK